MARDQEASGETNFGETGRPTMESLHPLESSGFVGQPRISKGKIRLFGVPAFPIKQSVAGRRTPLFSFDGALFEIARSRLDVEPIPGKREKGLGPSVIISPELGDIQFPFPQTRQGIRADQTDIAINQNEQYTPESCSPHFGPRSSRHPYSYADSEGQKGMIRSKRLIKPWLTKRSNELNAFMASIRNLPSWVVRRLQFASHPFTQAFKVSVKS